jgi:DNA-binding NarL/FixJ family response regulator
MASPPPVRTYFVEDNPTIRENLTATLEELGGVSPIGYAETEHQGSAWLCGHADAWDLAIVDLFLKQGSGLGVIQSCRQRQPSQKVVVLTNYATPDIRARCEQLGVDAVFDKSNDIDALVDFCLGMRSAAA